MSRHREADVAVVIPTFDRPALLEETLASVLAQTRRPREIVVVDNGTNDDTRTLMARYGDEVRYVRERPRAGTQVARNAGVAASSAEWIALLDDDDLFAPDRIEACEPAMADGRADIVACDHRKFEGVIDHPRTNFDGAPDGYWQGVPRPEGGGCWSFVDRFPVERLLRYIPSYPSQLLIRRDLYARLGGYDPSLRGMVAEDIDFLARAFSRGRLAVAWRPLIRYRLHASNDSTGFDAQAWGRWTVFNHLRDKGAELDPIFRAALERELPALRARAFDAAFGVRRYDEMRALAPALRRRDWTWRRLLKRGIAAAPAPLRAWAGLERAAPNGSAPGVGIAPATRPASRIAAGRA